MGKSGDMAKYISLYLNGLKVEGFKNIDDMKASETIGFGSICKTLGNTNYLAGDGHFYNVRRALTTDNIDDVNIIALKNPELVAEKIPDFYKEEIQDLLTNINNNVETLTTRHNNEIGNLNDLKTNYKNNIVTALNETYDKINTSITESINDKVGNLENLYTDDKSNVVNSLNSIKLYSESLIGHFENLTTNQKGCVVDAINEINSKNIPISQGGTGAGTPEQARENLGGILAPTVLYDNNLGTTSSITLPQPVGNFKYIEIYYKDESHQNGLNSSTKSTTAQYFYVPLIINNMGANNYYSKCSTVLCNETEISFGDRGWLYRDNGTVNSESKISIWITKVVGYK